MDAMLSVIADSDGFGWRLGHAPVSAEKQMKYVHQAETFSTARRALMLPHPRGEQDSIARALHECRLGLHDLDRDGLDENARGRVKRLEELMATAGFSGADHVGAGAVKVSELSLEEKFELSRIIDELAYWFRQKCLSSAHDQKQHRD
jgi:hypothetical protein